MNNSTANKTIRTKLNNLLNEEMGALSSDMKKILLDDLVCAFESRLKVLSKAEAGLTFMVAPENTQVITIK
jgi:hypothetical protein